MSGPGCPGYGDIPILPITGGKPSGDPGTLLTLRFSGAAIVLLLLAFGRRATMPTGRSLVGLLLMGGVGYVSQSLSYFTALTMTFKMQAKQVTQSGAVFTVALRKLPAGWRIAAWAGTKGTSR